MATEGRVWRPTLFGGGRSTLYAAPVAKNIVPDDSCASAERKTAAGNVDSVFASARPKATAKRSARASADEGKTSHDDEGARSIRARAPVTFSSSGTSRRVLSSVDARSCDGAVHAVEEREDAPSQDAQVDATRPKVKKVVRKKVASASTLEAKKSASTDNKAMCGSELQVKSMDGLASEGAECLSGSHSNEDAATKRADSSHALVDDIKRKQDNPVRRSTRAQASQAKPKVSSKTANEESLVVRRSKAVTIPKSDAFGEPTDLEVKTTASADRALRQREVSKVNSQQVSFDDSAQEAVLQEAQVVVPAASAALTSSDRKAPVVQKPKKKAKPKKEGSDVAEADNLENKCSNPKPVGEETAAAAPKAFRTWTAKADQGKVVKKNGYAPAVVKPDQTVVATQQGEAIKTVADEAGKSNKAKELSARRAQRESASKILHDDLGAKKHEAASDPTSKQAERGKTPEEVAVSKDDADAATDALQDENVTMQLRQDAATIVATSELDDWTVDEKLTAKEAEEEAAANDHKNNVEAAAAQAKEGVTGADQVAAENDAESKAAGQVEDDVAMQDTHEAVATRALEQEAAAAAAAKLAAQKAEEEAAVAKIAREEAAAAAAQAEEVGRDTADALAAKEVTNVSNESFEEAASTKPAEEAALVAEVAALQVEEKDANGKRDGTTAETFAAVEHAHDAREALIVKHGADEAPPIEPTRSLKDQKSSGPGRWRKTAHARTEIGHRQQSVAPSDVDMAQPSSTSHANKCGSATAAAVCADDSEKDDADEIIARAAAVAVSDAEGSDELFYSPRMRKADVDSEMSFVDKHGRAKLARSAVEGDSEKTASVTNDAALTPSLKAACNSEASAANQTSRDGDAADASGLESAENFDAHVGAEVGPDEEAEVEAFLAVCSKCGATHAVSVDFMAADLDLDLNFTCAQVGETCENTASSGRNGGVAQASIVDAPLDKSEAERPLTDEERKLLFKQYGVGWQDPNAAKQAIAHYGKEFARGGDMPKVRYRDGAIATWKGEKVLVEKKNPTHIEKQKMELQLAREEKARARREE
eukprot:TRINITY_DN17964_c0_g1_i2.p1 TRINITY_DN17964_c0_g1~~TRINITY_DN17964_c0_g1_i2.p1  ORF type:complete len:1054 (+),score=245.36 TRINITY_DN17964_c0_g1_i2:246-3407(+)